MTATPAPGPLVARADTLSGGGSSADRGAQRLAQLADRAAALRSRRGPGAVPDRWLLLVGGTAMPLGVLLILLGWYGSAQTALPFEQTPYLISGGILGLALVVGGGFLYFAYWLTVSVREARSERERTAEHQERLERVLVELAGTLGAANSRPAVERVVRTPRGTLLHRPDCVATLGLDVVDVEASEPGHALCGLCSPVAPPPALPAQAAPPVRRPRAARTPR